MNYEILGKISFFYGTVYLLLITYGIYHLFQDVIPAALRESIERLVKKKAKEDDAPPALKKLKLSKTEKGNKYPIQLREFAVTVHFYSARLYEQLREKWSKILPASSTLKAWFREVDGKPGFTNEAFTTLARIAAIRINPVVCNVCIDEMSIKQSVEFIRGRTYGYVNFGAVETDADTEKVASHVLVFLVVSLNGSWKVPIGYFPISSLAGSIRGQLLKIGLELLHDANIHIYSATFDGASSNKTMCTSIGANFDYFSTTFKPWLQHPVTENRVSLFLDAAHMLKLNRNTLGERGPIYRKSTNTKIDWNDIKKLHKKQEIEGLHAANKLTKRHIDYTESKMNVRLAAQTLSGSVSCALEFMRLIDPDFNDVSETATFCQVINDAFDILNCRNFYSKNPFNKPLNETNREALKKRAREIEDYICDLEINDHKGNRISILKSDRNTGFLGMIINLRNLFDLYEDVSKLEMKFLLSYKLSQDHLENFFSAVRSRGFNDNPTARQFESTYKRLLVHAEIRSSEKSNCAWDGLSILTCSSQRQKRSVLDLGQESELDFAEELEDHDYIFTTWTVSEYTEKVISYIAGFVVFSLQKKTSCAVCKNELMQQDSSEARSDVLLIKIKTRGGLIIPSLDVVKICKVTESIFRQHLNNMAERNFVQRMLTYVLRKVGSDVFLSEPMRQHTLEQPIMEDHRTELIRLVAELFLQIRMRYEGKVLSQPKSYFRRKFHKLIHFLESQNKK